jgi:hypothetical protein
MFANDTILLLKKETTRMKHSRAQLHCKTHKIPTLQFDDHALTSFSGLVVFQGLFAKLEIKERLGRCFNHLGAGSVFGYPVIILSLVVHLLLGFRRLRECESYQDDPMVQRLLGLTCLPDVATLSRHLAQCDAAGVRKFLALIWDLVVDRVRQLRLSRLTLDLDGSALSTGRWAEGTAVGFNKEKKGARSYYPLFCTVAQTGQVLSVLHRPGNVHDSNGARTFVLDCIRRLRQALPRITIELRMDSAFFSHEMAVALDAEAVEFTISVPFERFAELKAMIETRQRWRSFDEQWSFFETPWKPKSWQRRYRFVFLRQKVKRQQKLPVQLDLFIPHQYGYDFKVILTNKQTPMNKVLAFHNGRGAQENLFGELKSQCQMDYIPVRTLAGNQIYLLCSILAHNLARELQMIADPPQRHTTEKRSPLWLFQELNTLRRQWLQRAGRFTWPQGRLTLTLGLNETVRSALLHYLAPFGYST